RMRDSLGVNPLVLVTERTQIATPSFGGAGDGSTASMDYIEALSDVQRARTFWPTAAIRAIATMTIRPATSAYSSTSPPCSSRMDFPRSFTMLTGTPFAHRTMRRPRLFSGTARRRQNQPTIKKSDIYDPGNPWNPGS